jgi:hypothetical protein
MVGRSTLFNDAVKFWPVTGAKTPICPEADPNDVVKFWPVTGTGSSICALTVPSVTCKRDPKTSKPCLSVIVPKEVDPETPVTSIAWLVKAVAGL